MSVACWSCWSANACAARHSERRSSSTRSASRRSSGRGERSRRCSWWRTSPPSSVTVAITMCPSERPAAASARIRSSSAPNTASRSRTAGRIAGERVRGGAGGDQVARVVCARGGDDAVDGGRADAAPRGLHGAPERLRVGRVGEQRQVGERVADLGALVQAEAAEHAVRDPGGRQRALHRAGGVPGAGEQQHVGRAACRPRARRRRRRRPRPPRRDRRRTPAPRRWPPGPRMAISALAVRCGLWATHAGGGLEDLGARAEVAGEHDPPVRRVAVAEAQDVAGLGAAEAVDRLVVVAGAGDVAVRPGEQVQQARLRLVGVLHLVDDEPFPALAQVREAVRVLGEQPHRVHEQVVERERVRSARARGRRRATPRRPAPRRDARRLARRRRG